MVPYYLACKSELLCHFYVNRIKTVRDILYLQNTRFLVPCSTPVIVLISQFWWFHVILYAKMRFLAKLYENQIKNGEDFNVFPNTPFWAQIFHILVFFLQNFRRLWSMQILTYINDKGHFECILVRRTPENRCYTFKKWILGGKIWQKPKKWGQN